MCSDSLIWIRDLSTCSEWEGGCCFLNIYSDFFITEKTLKAECDLGSFFSADAWSFWAAGAGGCTCLARCRRSWGPPFLWRPRSRQTLLWRSRTNCLREWDFSSENNLLCKVKQLDFLWCSDISPHLSLCRGKDRDAEIREDMWRSFPFHSLSAASLS